MEILVGKERRKCAMFFETKDLVVDKLTILDSSDFHRICNLPFILKWMGDWEMSLEQVENLLLYFIKGYEIKKPEDVPFIMAIRTKSRKFIGICGFGPKEELGGDVEIAYFIDESYSGKGYMGQVVEKAVDFYFALTNKTYLSALVDENNTPSKKILENNGVVYKRVDDSNGILESHYRRVKG